MQDQRFGEPVQLPPRFQPFSEAASILLNPWLVATSQNHLLALKAALGALERPERQRFECFPEPAGGWVVWDNEIDEPTMLSEVLLSGVSEAEAFFMVETLNDRTRLPFASGNRGPD